MDQNLTELTEGVEISMLENVAFQYYRRGETWVEWGDAEGVSSRTLVKSLAHNALVRAFTVRVAAARADGTTLANAGQVRLQAETEGSKIIVVDFGMLRTVSGVGRVDGAPAMRICYLRRFKGDQFDNVNLYFEDCETDDIDAMMIRSAEENSFETRTDRVRLKVKSSASLSTLSSAIWLQFPDLPSDLDIRINGGAPAWTAPGVAQPNTRGWDENTQQDVDLTSALAALTGDPHDASPLETSIVLSSRIPGILAIEEVTVDVAYLARVAFGDAEETTLVIDAEGQYDVVLALPSWVNRVQEVRFTVAGTVASERILEPVGPPPALLSGGSGVAYELLLDVDHAAAARLDAATPFAEIVAVRMPLRAGADGAEVRAVLHEGTDNGPTRPVDGGTSTPVDLPPGSTADTDVWTTFSMPKPVKRKPELVYWVVVVVGRGSVSWSLGQFVNAGVAVPIRRGAATGPWHELPNVTLASGAVGARIRAVGKASPAAPVAPLLATIVGHETSQIAVTPVAKGIAATWVAPGSVVGTTHPSIAPSGPSSAPTITLRLTSRMTGTIKLSAVDVVATK